MQHNIPTVKCGDFIMNESRAAAAYLVNKFGKDDSLYPKEAEVRARVDQRLYFDMGTFYPAFGDLVYPIMFETGVKPGQDKSDKFQEVMGWMNDFVAGDKFAAGTSQMTIADLSLLATYSSIRAAGDIGGVKLSNYANIEAWYQKCIKLVPNYEKANGAGATEFGEYYKAKC